MSCEVKKKDQIPQGDSYPLSWGVTGVTDLTDWTCYLQVRTSDTAEESGISREVTTLNVAGDRFITSLTSAETSSLSIRKYIVGAELANASTGESGEILMELDIKPQWVVRP